MNFIETTEENIKRIKGLSKEDPLISLYEDNNGRNFLGISAKYKNGEEVIPLMDIKEDEIKVTDSKCIRNHILTRILDKKSYLDFRFKISAKEYYELKFLGEFHTGKFKAVYANSTKLLTYPGFGVRCRSFDNNDPFKKNHDGLKKLSKKLD